MPDRQSYDEWCWHQEHFRHKSDKKSEVRTSDLPRRELPFNFELLSEISNDDAKLPTLFGLGSLDDGQHINASFCYTISGVAEALGYDHWYPVNTLIKKIIEEKGINIKDSNNRYHLKIKSGQKSNIDKYSKACIDLLEKVKNELPYEIDI